MNQAGFWTAIIIVNSTYTLAEGYRFHLCYSLNSTVINIIIAGNGLTLTQPVLLPNSSLQTGRGKKGRLGGRMEIRDRMT